MISARSPFETHCGKSGHGTNKAERDNGIFHLTEEAGAEEEEEEEEGGRPPRTRGKGTQTFLRRRRRRFCRIGVEWSRSGCGGEGEDKVTSLSSAVIHA